MRPQHELDDMGRKETLSFSAPVASIFNSSNLFLSERRSIIDKGTNISSHL
jgi:hypothetical protein